MDILDTIQEYKSIGVDENALEMIMDLRKKMSIQLVELSISVGISRKNWKMAKMRLTSLEAQEKIKLTSKHTLAKSVTIIDANPFKEKEKSVKWEIDYYRKELIMTSVREVLSEMNQRISYLKEEKKQNDYHENLNKN